MKRLASTVTIMATAVLLTGVPLLADENTMGDVNQKNECLLISKNCSDSVDSIQQRIERLNKEIGKGTAVYTRDELGTLNRKLDEATRMLETILSGV